VEFLFIFWYHLSMALDEIRKIKIGKVDELRKSGIDPYPSFSNRTHKIAEALEDFEALSSSKEEIVLVGRILARREHGGSTFFDINDGSVSGTAGMTGKAQCFIKEDIVGAEKYNFFKNFFDIGDFVEAKGFLFKTKKEEKTLEVKDFKLLTKALLPLPEKWHGLQDVEERLRKRYLDFIFNPESRDVVEKRSVFWSAVREFHIKHGFLEVETPVLETTVGGADATPFKTHHNALDIDVYLRISAGELWQKRLMVAGFNKTFEIGRIFRNEGMSPEHLQDYTQCEAYWAYAGYQDMYKFLQECYRYVAEKTFGTLKFQINGFDVDLGTDWPLIDYSEEVKKQTGVDIWKASDKDIKDKLNELGVEYNKAENRARLIDSLWKYCRKNIGGPAILINEPKIVSPLSKITPGNPDTTERFHFVIAGSEVGQGYSELNDPIDQRERFEVQEKMRESGDAEAQFMDKDFVEALEYGMPPTTGHGFSERLFSFLMNKPIRETQIFPLMKPRD